MNLLRVTVTSELIEELFTPRDEIRTRCIKGLPEGARLIHADWRSLCDSPLDALTDRGDVLLTFEVPGPTKPHQRIRDLKPVFGAER